TLAVLRNLAAFATGVPDQRFSQAHAVYPTLHKPELLLLAGLFHDIAKGRGGDHSELGAVDARAFCEAHGLDEPDTALVEWLVLRHLLMSVTAQKQDIADPAVIHRFAGEVADRERLDYLYLLTCADIAGTSPKLWNAWKDRLLADLRNATRLALRRGLEHPVAAAERIAGTRAAAASLLADKGIDPADADALRGRFPANGLLRARAEQIAWPPAARRWRFACTTRTATACSRRSWSRSTGWAWRSSRRARSTGRAAGYSTVSRCCRKTRAPTASRAWSRASWPRCWRDRSTG